MTTTFDRMVRAMQASPAWPAVFDAGSARVLLIAALREVREPDLHQSAAMLMGQFAVIAAENPLVPVPALGEMGDDEAKARYFALGARSRHGGETDAAWRAGIDHILSEAEG